MTESANKKANRCGVCKKKLGLLAQQCKCEKLFCIAHLHAEEHGCTFDYSNAERKLLVKATMVGPLSDKMTDRC